jgi:hypothetical protein
VSAADSSDGIGPTAPTLDAIAAAIADLCDLSGGRRGLSCEVRDSRAPRAPPRTPSLPNARHGSPPPLPRPSREASLAFIPPTTDMPRLARCRRRGSRRRAAADRRPAGRSAARAAAVARPLAGAPATGRPPEPPPRARVAVPSRRACATRVGAAPAAVGPPCAIVARDAWIRPVRAAGRGRRVAGSGPSGASGGAGAASRGSGLARRMGRIAPGASGAVPTHVRVRRARPCAPDDAAWTLADLENIRDLSRSRTPYV